VIYGNSEIPEGFTGVIPPKAKGDRYTYCVDGKQVPSVTSILSNNCGWGNGPHLPKTGPHPGGV